MADDTFPAEPVKTGPASATPNETATAPAPKAAKAKPAEPAKKTGKGKSTKKSAKTMIKDEASKLSKQAGEKARGYARDGKDRASGAIDEFAKLLDDAAGSVDSHMGEQYGKYARSAAGQVSGFADTLRSREVEELLDDTRTFVRKNPAIAIGAAAAAGFLLARVLKAGIDQAGDGFDEDDFD
ncbi:hypothetical protein [Stakelama pacifica]|uniref:ElaB/YqjD/DUF883 family membrane-anchored ribosome-binding protein n=1 Tax=Stakelama pacifica TaxID=517720 RepID=A0A4R6FZ37_9SPHN|nr:hypothetical protein [Stakelama pacifica]TDN86650.1 hypothetical protein EV664_101224 [Stakelama pacifica]GGO90275.1 hypothetical protein GCM10011329_02200 [Stakelama pacifica]